MTGGQWCKVGQGDWGTGKRPPQPEDRGWEVTQCLESLNLECIAVSREIRGCICGWGQVLGSYMLDFEHIRNLNFIPRQ